MTVAIVPPNPYFPFTNKGKPVFNGPLYIGEAGKNPKQFPKQVTAIDSQGVATPLPTGVNTPCIYTGSGGVPLYNGIPVRLVVDGDYSILLDDSNGVQIYYSQSETGSYQGDGQTVINDFEALAAEALRNVGGIDVGNYEDNVILGTAYDYAVFDRAGTPSNWKVKAGVSLPYQINSTTYPTPQQDPNLQAFYAFDSLQTIARALNALDSQVIDSTDTSHVLDDVLYIYDDTAQVTWGVPPLDTANETIQSVIGSQLITNPSSAMYTLESISTKNAILNITSFGVKGGGVVDDTVAVQAAIDSGVDFTFDVESCLIGGAIDFSSANQNIYLNGCTLLSKPVSYMNLKITADDVTIDLGGGVIDQGRPWGEVSTDVAAGSAIIPLLDASRFEVGDIVVSSWGSADGSGYPLVGPTAPTINKKTVISKTATSITLSSPMDGTNGLPAGLKIGDFAFGSLFGPTGKRALVKNGILTNVRGFYSFTPNDAVAGDGVKFDSIYFENNDVDQFLTQLGAHLEITNSRIEQNIDVAKTGLVMGNSQVRMSNVTGLMGNYDATIILSGTKADHTDSSLVIDNCEISGATSLDKNTTVGGDFANDVLTPIEVDFNGTCAGVRVSNTYFKNYTRHFFSSLTDVRTGSTTINHAIFTNVKADCSMYNFIFGAGGTLTIPTFTFDNCDIFQINEYILGSLSRAGGIINAEPVISGTTFRVQLSNANYTFDGGAVLNDCTFKRVGTESTFTWAYNRTFLNNCTFENTKLAIAPTYSNEFLGNIGNVIIDHPDFPHNASAVIDVFGTSSDGNGMRAMTAKSKNGTFVYNVWKWFGTAISADVYGCADTFNFTGDDYFIPKGCAVIDMLNGTRSPVTFGWTAELAVAVSSGTTIVIDAVGGSGNRPESGDHVNVVLDNERVFTSTVAAGRPGNDASTTFILDDAIPSLASIGNKVQFFRY